MQQIINFVIRNKNFLLYLLLLIISLGFTIQSHSYHQSRFFNSANWISGNIYAKSHSITSYFDLKEENKKLVAENQRLRTLVFNRDNTDSMGLATVEPSYVVTTAQVINNSFSKSRNYITINKGSKDSLLPDMGVVTGEGILGIIENISGRYATVQSILNENSSINAKIKNSNHFGSLVWDTKDYNIVQLIDIPRMVPLTIGDTIVTGAMSSIFPENIPIGTIQKYDLDTSNSFYLIDIALFNDMANIKNVYIVNNLNRKEIMELESKNPNE